MQSLERTRPCQSVIMEPTVALGRNHFSCQTSIADPHVDCLDECNQQRAHAERQSNGLRAASINIKLGRGWRTRSAHQCMMVLFSDFNPVWGARHPGSWAWARSQYCNVHVAEFHSAGRTVLPQSTYWNEDRIEPDVEV